MFESLQKEIAGREHPGGGFAEQPGGGIRPDATAWAIMALGKGCADSREPERWRKRLMELQQSDGRVPLSTEHPQAFWPTSLAVLAWQGAEFSREAQKRAVRFLVATSGTHWPKKADSPVAHDPSLLGWPWIEGTHSWVEPTALGLMALNTAGEAHNSRAAEARKLLLDRQLPQGGWNYGNTRVFGRELCPLPETTSLALQALADQVPKATLDFTLDYLRTNLSRLCTPLSLGWAVLGLAAWGERPAAAEKMIAGCFERQTLSGRYTTSQLAILLLALRAPEGLTRFLA